MPRENQRPDAGFRAFCEAAGISPAEADPASPPFVVQAKDGSGRILYRETEFTRAQAEAAPFRPEQFASIDDYLEALRQHYADGSAHVYLERGQDDVDRKTVELVARSLGVDAEQAGAWLARKGLGSSPEARYSEREAAELEALWQSSRYLFE